MALSEAQTAAMKADLLRGGDVVSVARAYGVSLQEVRDVKFNLQAPPKAIDPEWGRPEIQQFAIARVRPGESWPRSDEIKQAHADYDAGLCEIATARINLEDGPRFILYKFPRVKADLKRTPYFSRNFNEG